MLFVNLIYGDLNYPGAGSLSLVRRPCTQPRSQGVSFVYLVRAGSRDILWRLIHLRFISTSIPYCHYYQNPDWQKTDCFAGARKLDYIRLYSRGFNFEIWTLRLFSRGFNFAFFPFCSFFGRKFRDFASNLILAKFCTNKVYGIHTLDT